MVAVQHDKNGRDHILDTAHKLFATHGFHQTSMAELASAAQVSVGQIYRLFKGKEAIIEAMVTASSNERETLFAAQRALLDSGEATIEEIFEQLLLLSVDKPDEALSFDILAEAFRNMPVGETIGAMCGHLRHDLRIFACAANPALSGEALDGAEELILACMFGLGHRSLSKPNLDAPTTARRAAQMIIAGLRAIH